MSDSQDHIKDINAGDQAEKLDYTALFHASPLSRVVLDVNAEQGFKVLDMNQAAAHYFDVDRNTVKGQPVLSFLAAENNDHIMRALGVASHTRTAVTIQALPKLPGGLRVQSFVINPILDTDGYTVRWLDMQARPAPVEQQAIERERDDALKLLSSVFETSELGIIVTDHHGRVVKVNKAFLDSFKWDSMTLIGSKFTVLLPEELHKAGWDKHDRGINEGAHMYGESRIVKQDGSVGNAIVSSVMLELSMGRRFIVSTVVNITHMKTMERKLRQAKEDADAANIAKSAFLANMSHELRTPLNAIIGFSDMMLKHTLGPIENAHYEDYLGDIHFSANHLLAIINGVLDMSKIEAGKMRLDEEDVDFDGLIDSVYRIMAPRAQEKDITLIKQYEAEDIKIMRLDERLVRQILINLVTNAIKFSENGSAIDITIIKRARHVVMRVKDRGIGIPEHLIGEVLQPFGQVSDPSINSGQGTGLGLPLAKAMMELHGGKLTISSKHGKGTQVDCAFPMKRAVLADKA